MVQSLAPAGKLDWKPVTEQVYQDLAGAATRASTKVPWTQEDGRKPDQESLTKFSGLPSEVVSGMVYLERNGSMWSLTATLGLSSCTKEIHS